jgi:predicted AlkP superfamily phosphohydrolase/phosphomutase
VVLTGCARERTQAAGRRVIVLGVDGMDPQFVQAHWDVLPNLRRLRDQGDFRPLATTVPPQSPVAWSTFITGMDPGGHGIFDFVHRDPATRMPFSSMAEATEPKHTLSLGPWVIPLSSGEVRVLRQGKAFWQVLSENGIHASVIRMPTNFPPLECEGHSLSGMGTPDMQGTFGTFTYYTNNPEEKRTQVPGGRIVRVDVTEGRAVLSIHGPVNSFRRERPPSQVDLIVHVDPTEPVARLEAGETQVVLKQGEWSGWLHLDFPLVPGLKSAAGMVRVLLRDVHPHLGVYVSPVNIDPARPELPISAPEDYSRELAEALGPFYTQGIPEDASALRAGVFRREDFVTQSRAVLADSMRMFRHELARFDSGLLFYYFSSLDQGSHMLWGKFEADLLEIYKAIDGAVGEAMRKAGDGTTLIVMSDHGFASFDRAVHLNTWLMREGFLALDDPTALGDQELFPHVDWSRSQAYSLGLNGVYLNLMGREPGGIVTTAERDAVLRSISSRLLDLKDPKTGLTAVEKVYRPEKTYSGPNIEYAPDLIVGFRRGYRASWQTALGALPPETFEDNDQPWIGDHCMASESVPGVFFANRKMRAEAPRLQDVTATILKEFGVPPASGMTGRALF